MEAKYEKKSEYLQCREGYGDGKSPLEIAPHLHYQIECFLLRAGETTVFIDSVEYTVKAGDLCMVFPNQIHQFKTTTLEDYTLVIVNPDMVPDFENFFINNIPESPVLENAVNIGNIPILFKKISEEYEKKSPYKEFIIKGSLLALFGEIFSEMKMRDLKMGDSCALKTVVNYCAHNFSKELSLSILEEELHISKYYISHLFSNRLKVRFNDYINSLRISDACRQLRQTDKTITEISECVGFNTLRTFNRSFMKLKGVSPSEYRRMNQNYSASGATLL